MQLSVNLRPVRQRLAGSFRWRCETSEKPLLELAVIEILGERPRQAIPVCPLEIITHRGTGQPGGRTDLPATQTCLAVKP
jgi:hypothetical protein